jgi:hypothetical protein
LLWWLVRLYKVTGIARQRARRGGVDGVATVVVSVVYLELGCVAGASTTRGYGGAAAAFQFSSLAKQLAIALQLVPSLAADHCAGTIVWYLQGTVVRAVRDREKRRVATVGLAALVFENAHVADHHPVARHVVARIALK